MTAKRKEKAKPKLGPVHINLSVKDCFFECPFYDGDEAESICEMGAKNLPIYDRVNKKCIPPVDCPFRKAKPKIDSELFTKIREVGERIQACLARKHLPHDSRIDLEMAESQMVTLLNNMKEETD